MALLVRERPPLRLNASVKPAQGPAYRWALDEPRAQDKPTALSFSTAMPGGFDQCSMTLERDPRVQWPDLQELSTLTVEGAGGLSAWQGRIEDIPSTFDPQSAGFQPLAVGWQAHLDDDDSASMVYIDRDLTQWQQPSTGRQLALVSDALGSFFSSQPRADGSGNPVLEMSSTGPLPAGSQQSEAWYDAGAGNALRYIRYSAIELLNSALSAGWGLTLGGSDDDVGTTFAFENPAGTGALVIDLTAASGTAGEYRHAFLAALYSAGAAGTGLTYGWQVQNLALVGDHGLAVVAGPSGISPGADDGILASDIIAHAIGAWCPRLAYTPGETILPSSYTVPQASFIAPTTASVIVKQASQYELLDWAVWEGPTFWSNPRGQYARARNWRARVGPSQLQATGPQSSRIWNGVVVTGTDVSGRTLVIGPAQWPPLLDPDPQNPANQAGLKRYAPLAVSGTTNPGAMVQIGQRFLAEQKLLDTAGQATLTGHVQDDHGVWWPAWLVRAGDTIAFVDAADSSPRRIVSTSYQHDSRANTVSLDQPPDALNALLSRLGASLSALAL